MFDEIPVAARELFVDLVRDAGSEGFSWSDWEMFVEQADGDLTAGTMALIGDVFSQIGDYLTAAAKVQALEQIPAGAREMVDLGVRFQRREPTDELRVDTDAIKSAYPPPSKAQLRKHPEDYPYYKLSPKKGSVAVSLKAA